MVTAFFEDMNAFLHRITILESRLPSYPAYRNCLMDVFSSLLEMCGFATKYIELGRFSADRPPLILYRFELTLTGMQKSGLLA